MTNQKEISLNEVRQKYLDFMRSHMHSVIPSSALVPENDPTTLFTGSGMQPMLPYLLGETHPLGVRIADSQKCFRSQDIEEVGDNRHTTFFEMLGNWSLGDYFKKEQIDMMWNFLINELHLDPNRLYITVYRGNQKLGLNRDDEAIQTWQEKFKTIGIDAGLSEVSEIEGVKEGERIFTYPDKKNWWSRAGIPENMPVGEPGGPDTEMFYDFEHGKDKVLHSSSQWKDEACHVNCDCGRFVEIGNNVFMQYMRTETGVEELKQKNVDFGGGLERMTAALRDDSDVFNIDAFSGAKAIIANISNHKYEGENVYAYRVILDHIRAATHLIGDGIFPGNKDQQYFVRRLIRRAVRFAKKLNVNVNFTKSVALTFIDFYSTEYTNLKDKQSEILKALDDEETKFRKTLENGLKEFEKLTNKSIVNNNTPPLGEGTGVGVISGNDAFNLLQSYGFPIELTEELAKEKGLTVDLENFKLLKDKHAEESRTASAGKFKGGLGGDGEMEIKYHTATHLLHQALRDVLGNEVYQKGSNINGERLRFDFSFDRKMTDEEKMKVEELVNTWIQKDFQIRYEELTQEEARSRGAIGLFGEKYGDKVKVYTIGEGNSRDVNTPSIEFCGGPHVEHTGLIGEGNKKFKISKEEAVSQGVRRIKAVVE